MKGWWHRLRYAECAICGREFRKGKGGGVSREVMCDDECYAWAWAMWAKPSVVLPEIDAKKARYGVRA